MSDPVDAEIDRVRASGQRQFEILVVLDVAAVRHRFRRHEPDGVRAQRIQDLPPTCRGDGCHEARSVEHRFVSGDADLLVMHPWRGVRILRPAEYLAEVGDAS